ncbi:MAG: response regulator transcription factor [Eubacterium sp.]|nr:response regulator transcription factor [Eubacterium sp.]
MYRILLVDDDNGMISMVKDYLTVKGYDIITATDGETALNKIKYEPDIILLDVNMPKMDGFEVCMKIRELVSCPIIFLTAREEEADRIKGLEIGGDDYILKPFSLKELAARIKAHLNREERIKRKSAIQYKDGLLIDYSSKKVTYGSEEINMTGLEFAIIEFLSLNPGRVYDIDSIYEHVGGYDSEAESRVITVLIGRIRKKIKEYTEHEYIETVWGVGYRWKS